jgi:hypothetical protein
MYPLLTTYIRTRDSGQELRYSLRSLKNLTNFNGEVNIVGDGELWFNNINRIAMRRIHGNPYGDQIAKLRHAAHLMPDKFIIGMDDVYCLEPTEAGFPNRGILESDDSNYYRRTKLNTIELLKEHGITDPLNYECHSFYLVEKDKLLQTFDIILSHPNKDRLQWRSVYGNLFKPDTYYYEDKKSYDGQLKKGAVVSTQFYTSVLDNLFPDKSEFEI